MQDNLDAAIDTTKCQSLVFIKIRCCSLHIHVIMIVKDFRLITCITKYCFYLLYRLGFCVQFHCKKPSRTSGFHLRNGYTLLC